MPTNVSIGRAGAGLKEDAKSIIFVKNKENA